MGQALAQRAILALGLLVSVACNRTDLAFQILDPDFAGGTALISIQLGPGLDAASLRIWLDRQRVEGSFAPVPGGVAGTLALTPGSHILIAHAEAFGSPGFPLAAWRQFQAPEPFLALVQSEPPAGAADVPRTAWLHLSFAAPAQASSLATLGLACSGQGVAIAAELLADGSVVVNPEADLPDSSMCRLIWAGLGGPGALEFATAPRGAPATALCDRRQYSFLAPFPDDYFLIEDASKRTGRRPDVFPPERPGLIPALFAVLANDTNQLDGWSPIAPFVMETSAPLDPDSLPRNPAESLSPLASVQLFDLSPGAPSPPPRVPFRVDVRSDDTAAGHSNVLFVWPSVPLAPQGHYAFVLTRRALVDPTRPLDPSAFTAAALGPPLPGEGVDVTSQRERLEHVLAVLEGQARPRLPREDLALVLPISVRSTDDIPTDLQAIKTQVLADPPPALLGFTVQAETIGGTSVAAIVRGTWDAPDWRVRSPGPAPNVTRGPDGLPVKQASRPVEFALALPVAANQGPVPVVMHQHGNPGSHEEVISNARRFLAAAGFATIGFSDILNREVATPTNPDGSPRSDEERIEMQVLSTFTQLFVNATVPDYWLETTAEQLAFLRFLEALAALDVLPLGAPDGVPDLDLAAPLAYHGISEGGNNGQAILAYAPELKSAALMVGGARLAEVLVHQQAGVFLEFVPSVIVGVLPSEIWVGVSLFQTIFDRQDRHNHLEFAFRRPLEIAGTTRKASVLLVEGLDDSLVPNHATESAAFQLGLPHLAPVQRAVPFLPVVTGPLRANLDSETTGGFFQYVPIGIPGIPPTPGCDAIGEPEGHYCAQSAVESRQQRAHFFQSALGDQPPEIIDPFAE